MHYLQALTFHVLEVCFHSLELTTLSEACTVVLWGKGVFAV